MNRIKELRKQRKITQKALADIFGVNVRTIQKWEHGDTAIKAVKTKKLADYFEISAQDLSNIKKQARCLYEDLVWMQFEAEEREGK